jgi:hypothetical protein
VRRMFELGGVLASAVLIAFGIGSIVVGALGIDEVRDTLARENIVGTPDMTPEASRGAAAEAGVTDAVPDCSVAEDPVDTGGEAKCFASYMRLHALEATGGETYADLDRFIAEGGGTTSDEEQAATNEEGRPVENPLRQVWITQTALATALNTAFFGERVAAFSIVMGIALLLTGVGFAVLTASGVLRRSSGGRTAVR